MIDLANNSVFDWNELKQLLGALGEDPSYKKQESVIVEYMNQFMRRPGLEPGSQAWKA